MKMRILVGLLQIAVVFGIYWLGGGNFERGHSLALTSIFALVLGVAVASYPASLLDRSIP